MAHVVASISPENHMDSIRHASWMLNADTSPHGTFLIVIAIWRLVPFCLTMIH
jgi:hypothetical protein